MAISLGQIDLEALKNYLKIVQGFRTVDDPSGDTEQVYGVDAALIARALLNEDGELLVDRDTIEKAANLVRINADGNHEIISANNILTLDEGENLQNSTIAVSKSTANDMRSLRNEMYHLKRDMIKSGAIVFDQVYDGYIDPFDSNRNLSTSDELLIEELGQDGSILISSGPAINYSIGQHAAIVAGSKIQDIKKINAIEQESIVTFEDGTIVLEDDPENGNGTLQKTYGIYEDGRFVFANSIEVSLQESNNAMNMIYKDGSDRVKIAELNKDNDAVGFASTIVVPAELDGSYLKSISASLRVIGQPGSCYFELYDYTEDMNYVEPLAVSNYLNAGLVLTSKWKSYTFNFDNPQILVKGHVYLLVMKTLETSNDNIWCIGGFTEQCNNSVHQDTYILDVAGGYHKQGVDVVTNKISDMFIGLQAVEQQEAQIDYAKRGMYTGTFDLKDNNATRCRISINPRKDENIAFYTVSVKGLNSDSRYIFGQQNGEVKSLPHTVTLRQEVSGHEFVYDFDFAESVSKIEFQIIFNSDMVVSADNHEALYSLVVSTDSGLLKEV